MLKPQVNRCIPIHANAIGHKLTRNYLSKCRRYFRKISNYTFSRSYAFINFLKSIQKEVSFQSLFAYELFLGLHCWLLSHDWTEQRTPWCVVLRFQRRSQLTFAFKTKILGKNLLKPSRCTFNSRLSTHPVFHIPDKYAEICHVLRIQLYQQFISFRTAKSLVVIIDDFKSVSL